uniref:Disease resistance RPP13-like protein 1 n=1 Tax=Rhizophora mucronata TaxID=61149 RepID=A0A2P2LYQ8_RHIMU
MAEQLVGGSFLSAFLQVLFDRMASREVVDFFKSQKLSDQILLLLNKLNATMISVNGLLDDAEEKQNTRPSVKRWLDELRDAVYEADDLLDEIAYSALRSKLEAGPQKKMMLSGKGQLQKFLSSYSPFKKGMEKAKLEEILERLEYLVKQKDALGLREGIGENPSLQKIPTTSLEDASGGVYGRDDDKEAMVKLLLSDDANGNDLEVIPVVGMGGIGKTTLAQLVYNDSRVQEWFDSKAWVCVSEEFKVFNVTKDILKEVTSMTCDAKTPNQLQVELKEKLMGKKLLLVLDDVWNDSYVDWDILQRPLKFLARGSKVIVTTRNESVALVMRPRPIYHLKELTDDNCWFLFAKHAFDDGNYSSYPDLEIYGRDIARKCKTSASNWNDKWWSLEVQGRCR